MNIRNLKLVFVLVICGTVSFSASGQQPVFVKCKVKDPTLRSVKYHIGEIYRENVKNGGPAALLVHIAVNANKINKDELVLIAKHLKEKFCNNKILWSPFSMIKKLLIFMI